MTGVQTCALPILKILTYTDKDNPIDYDKYLENGADSVLWRGVEGFYDQARIILKWLETEDEKT